MNLGDSAFAQVEPLPAGNADKILSARSLKRVRTLYRVIFPLFFLVGIGLWVWAQLSDRQELDAGGSPKFLVSDLLWLGSLSIFAGLLLVRLVVGNRNQWLRRVAKNEVNLRPDKCVDPDACGVHFVEVVPKSNWQDETLLENATDVGFLAVAPARDRLLFEGDNERYLIPAQAIVKCEQDSYTRLVQDPFSKGPHNKIIYYHFVVVTLKISQTMTAEIPFRIRKTVSLLSDQPARDANHELYREITGMKAVVPTVT
jgi:hypothetical protein